MQQSSSYVKPSFPQIEQNHQDSIPNKELIPNKNNLNQTTQKHLLYFSHYCKFSKILLNQLNSKDLLNKVELICVDNRFVKENITYIVLPSNQNMPLPPMIQRVPCLCILPNYEILKGNQILHYFLPVSKTLDEEKEKIDLEPNPFSIQLETSGSYGVTSDNFSFWDSDQEQLKASGNAGMKQMYNYVSVNDNTQENIYTPQEQESNTTNLTLEQLQQQRQNEI
tara:strand:+ start:221 stop:892 length:672 start_codon:yes stop_codon:yes gene_type:complete